MRAVAGRAAAAAAVEQGEQGEQATCWLSRLMPAPDIVAAILAGRDLIARADGLVPAG